MQVTEEHKFFQKLILKIMTFGKLSETKTLQAMNFCNFMWVFVVYILSKNK